MTSVWLQQQPGGSSAARPRGSAGAARQRAGVAPLCPPPPAIRQHLKSRAASLRLQLQAARRPLVAVAAQAAAAHWTLESYDDEMGWRSDFNLQYQVDSAPVGQGSFGSVYRGVSRSTGKEVAVKVLPKVRGKLTREKTLEKLAREVDMMERVQSCPGVVQLEDVFEDADAVSIVTELCSGGDLQQFAEARGSLDERALAHVAFEVLKLVKACHDAGLLHGDVKPANFCLKHATQNPLASPHPDWALPTAPAWLKAIDFGCSQILPAHRQLTKRTGTPVYMAPEVYQRSYNREADMWSIGVMLYQLYARRFPFWDTMEGCKSSQLDEVARAVQTADISFNYGPWLRMSPEGRAFVSACLQRDPAERLTVQQALQHPWLACMLRGAAPAPVAAAAAAAAPAPQPQTQPAQPQPQPQYNYPPHLQEQHAAVAAAMAAAAAAAAAVQHPQQQHPQQQQPPQQQPQQQQAQPQQVMASVRAAQPSTWLKARVQQQAAALVAAGPTPYVAAPPQQQQQQQPQQQQQQHQSQWHQQQQHSSGGRVAAAQAA